ncbi:anti-phage dCTP deaminase [Pseudomonas sp. R5(2019)]|uniref:anti-phage dCTP deaminase n=1 Tax=Pseudomonas sp. R5(2019) TaxID=2697566 RepID=UPI001411CB04|nr:anti-phage dCTP deaminase [Pseudomonas sp. R5(2019)]NBA98401.1 cytidine deaminase [Pseudomonas sp. R5(2019)]
MKVIFTESYEALKAKLKSIGAEWDESQLGKKVLRHDGGVMNWFESTGTIQFQGKPGKKESLEHLVTAALAPEIQLPPLPETTQPITEPELIRPNQDDDISVQHLQGVFCESEIIIGIVSAVGTESNRVINPLKDRLGQFGYSVEEIKISSLLTPTKSQAAGTTEYRRIKSFMQAGDQLRQSTKNNAILSYGAAKCIKEQRRESSAKRAYIVNSLKHPEEVELLRKIYGQGFYLFGIHADPKRRLHYLTNDKGLTQSEAIELTKIDEDENITHGQRTRDTYHLADFFINLGKNDDQVKNTVQRFLELILSHPYKNPTFDEFAMFMAFSSSVRSSDLSRQVGAVISKDRQIIATGANDSPKFGGGLYWAEVDENSGEISDIDQGKDYTRGEDSNKAEQNEIIREILQDIDNIEQDTELPIQKIQKILESSRIRDLTEFGRVVHAEMEALLSCSRSGTSCSNAYLYCTTFPCHNCAKHIIAAGIKRVVYVEPYPKSKALEFYADSIELNTTLDKPSNIERVIFEPFTGVGARRFLDFFSMNLGAGSKLKRKNKDGSTVEWSKLNAKARVSLLPKSYLDIEMQAEKIFTQYTQQESE